MPSCKVLIVDDEPVVRRLLREILDDADFELFEAGSVGEGRGLAAQCLPDVVLVDKNLPDGSGLELIRALKSDQPGLEAILITGYASIDSAIAAIAVGAFDYLVKPFPDLQTVLLKVRSAADKTRLARLEAQHRHAQKMEALGRLAGGVAHDFNNLLCIVMVCAGEALRDIKEGTIGPETTQALTDVLGSVDSATRLTRQLLAFSRRPSGKLELLDLNRVIEELRSMLSRVIGPEVELKLSLDPAVSVVRMSRTHLEQVLANLVVNARDAIDSHGTLTIGTAANAGEVVITVRDTGSGMVPDVAARIFEPFFTTKAVGRGTGLGLAMVRTIVEESGGNIAVESTPGVGTCFFIKLPATTASAGTSDPLEPRVTVPMSRGERVLIVEDDDCLRDVLTRVFQRTGYDVTAARDGDAALDCFASAGGAYDLLVTDMVMPRRSGGELAELLSRQRPALKTVFISGNAEHIDASDGQHNHPFLAKPFSEHELGTVVRQLLRTEIDAS